MNTLQYELDKKIDFIAFPRKYKFDLRPVYQCLQNQIGPLGKTMQWGPLVPYNITGQMNRHPRSAIKFLDGPDSDKYLEFYDRCVADED